MVMRSKPDCNASGMCKCACTSLDGYSGWFSLMDLACPAERVYDKPEPVRAPQRDRGGPAPTHACSARTPGGGHDERWLDIMVGWEPDDVLAGAALRVPARG